MVELEHRSLEPPELTQFRTDNPNATVADFDKSAFQSIKNAIKTALNQEQGGLCVYCEQKLEPIKGQIEHIKPKAGDNAHPDLCFIYTNYAHSCINNKTCGQKKKNGLLPIEPRQGCNTEWELSTDGTIQPISGLSKRRTHEVTQTRDMLGLNADTNLVIEREKWVKQAQFILENQPEDFDYFLQEVPFRYILHTL